MLCAIKLVQLVRYSLPAVTQLTLPVLQRLPLTHSFTHFTINLRPWCGFFALSVALSLQECLSLSLIHLHHTKREKDSHQSHHHHRNQDSVVLVPPPPAVRLIVELNRDLFLEKKELSVIYEQHVRFIGYYDTTGSPETPTGLIWITVCKRTVRNVCKRNKTNKLRTLQNKTVLT